MPKMKINLPEVYRKYMVTESEELKMLLDSGYNINNVVSQTPMKLNNSSMVVPSSSTVDHVPEQTKVEQQSEAIQRVETFLKKGQKFKQTLKHGFPVVARRTIQAIEKSPPQTQQNSARHQINIDLRSISRFNEIQDRAEEEFEQQKKKAVTPIKMPVNQDDQEKIQETSKRPKSSSMHIVITPTAKNLNFNSEMELGQSMLKEFDSDDENFLVYELPKHIPDVPACHCNRNGYCEIHQVKEPSIDELVRLLDK
jgi:hypothetical protein